MDDLEARFAKRLIVERKVRRVTQEALAGRVKLYGLDIEQPMISQIENGKRSISLNEAAGLARCLGMTLTEFCYLHQDLPSGRLDELLADSQAHVEILRATLADLEDRQTRALEILNGVLGDVRAMSL